MNSLSSGHSVDAPPRADSWQSIQPSIRPETGDERTFATGNTLIGVVALLVFIATTFAFTATVVGGAGLATMFAQDGTTGFQRVLVPASDNQIRAESRALEPPAQVASVVVAARPVGNAVRFASELRGTRRISVRCDSGSVQGSVEVALTGQTHGDCTVTAIGQDRVRRTAVVKDVVAGTYVCFANDGSQCD